MAQDASKIPNERAETVFEDFKPAYTQAQATVEANRCLFCEGAPCVTACPTGIEVPQFIRKIATGNLHGSAKTIFEANILGMSCARVCPVEVLCVGACVHNEQGVPPIQIGKLQRHATDHAFEKGWRFFEAGADTGKSVALIGAGPASLACAHELRRFGHRCTIYEKRDVVGGLNTTGVAPYKMKADRSDEEVRWILDIGGIDVRTGVAVGDALGWDDLQREHDAVFIGVGLGADSRLGVPGEDLAGVQGAVAAIERMKLGRFDVSGVGRAVVVGGGNTAIDAVRELIGLGIPDVTMVYRGTEAKMSGYAHEWAAAKIEGARALWRVQPVGFEGAGKLERLRLARLGEDKRPIPGEELAMDAQLALVAIGQGKLEALVAGLDGVKTDRGRIVVDQEQATGRVGVFAGGDCANGGKEVVNAAAEGKVAARSIHRHLTGEST
jgi:dihydropyrimidine dehydrogenase (NAD+) subunit PreT